MILDLYKLSIFSAVVREGSFSRAAEALFITQSAVSQHIKELEASIGRQLFERGRRGVALTAHGETLHRYASQIFALVAEAENALVDVAQVASGRLSIGATPGVGIYLVPEWVQQFRQRFPQLSVATKTGVTSEIVQAVMARRLELGFIEGEPDASALGRLATWVLAPIEQQVVVGQNHPLWGSASLRLDDLARYSFIVRQAHSQSRIWLEETLRQRGIAPNIGAEFDNLESMKRGVALGGCLAIMPPYVVRTEVAQGLLHAIPIEGQPLTRDLKLIWDAQMPFSPIASAFLKELMPFFPTLGLLLGQKPG